MEHDIYSLVEKLFPICRSITGDGNRQTLDIISEYIPIVKHEVPTGYQAFDWEVPEEWNIRDAYILNENNEKIVDFKSNNLHVLNYSIPINKTVTLGELDKHLYSIPEMPEAIPYVTSYYEKRWGFCISHNQRKLLKDEKYKVVIDSDLKNGHLTYGELIIPGKTEKEVPLTTYICHPSMANNECSGPAVTTFLAKSILEKKERKYTYRIVFAPETIGAITYISKNFDCLKKNTVAGFNITCVGDDRQYSYLKSRLGNTITDKIAKHVLDNFVENYIEYPFLAKGSDERQYCHPHLDLPLVSIMRSKYGTYPEYHNSNDNLDFVTPDGLFGAFKVLEKCIDAIESNEIYITAFPCEPKMIKRNLHPKDWFMRRAGGISPKTWKSVRDMMNVIFYCDGAHDVIDIANTLDIPFDECAEYCQILKESGVLTVL